MRLTPAHTPVDHSVPDERIASSAVRVASSFLASLAMPLVLPLITFLLVSIFALTSAWAHQCRFYRNDKRNLCLAQNEDKSFYCSFIKDSDQQRYCYAYVERAPAQCTSITDEALKAQCNTEAQARAAEAEAQRKAEEDARKAKEDARKAEEAKSGGTGAKTP